MPDIYMPAMAKVEAAPVNDFYKGLNKYYAINGIGQIEEIFGRISEVIDSTK